MGKAFKNAFVVVVSQFATFFMRCVLCHSGILSFSQATSAVVVKAFIEAGYHHPGGGPEDLEPEEDPEPEDLEESDEVAITCRANGLVSAVRLTTVTSM